MSTNYYLHPPKCGCCHHVPPPIHVGKASSRGKGKIGWTFRQYLEYTEPHDGRDIGDAMPPIETWEDWQEFLGETSYELRNEYGDVVDKSLFVDGVNSSGYKGFLPYEFF